MFSDEKLGGRKHPYALLAGFSETVMECGLSDLGYTGEKFTWERARGTEGWIQERLDRGLSTKEWLELFPDAEVRVLEVSISDHMPLYLQLNRKIYVPKDKRFHFENMWIQEKDCRNIIEDCWKNGDSNDLLEKMARCCARLEEWGGGMLREMKLRIVNCRKEMQRLRSRRDEVGIRRYGEIRWEFLKLLDKQEVYWSQRAKQYWLRDGDKNTRFFHKYASTRKEHNRIKKLRDEDGEWKDTDAEIQEVIIKYFENMFRTVAIEEQMSDRMEFKRITEEQSQELMSPVTDEEVRDAVFAMRPEKSPGIDGLTQLSFKHTGA